ncbi:hypothetical protein OCK74_07435 [Chitinophagaceae bacterium LB-8]|uniref:DUF4350 domain-containing protein n=1 Tax=Paraflavisolibacter caeni TaxID=2982496 RepID=A0A9X2XWE6_9BACT|nr:DUF4350 domain-containing protein [Paraflavisolibacter caeni]MCU7548943.1 hypothetical protein [Paraflavisolibacter caeni]
MKKYSLFFIVAVSVIAFMSLLLISAKNRPRKFNPRITLRHNEKIPYGTNVAYQLLPALFPNASVSYDKKRPGDWDSLDYKTGNQAVIIVTKDFNAEVWELEPLKDFAQNGNYVFIIANTFSYEANRYFHTRTKDLVFDEYFGEGLDSLQLNLENPPFINHLAYQYPGRKYEASFIEIDTLRTNIMGRNEKKQVNFIQMNTGKGHFYLHLAPLAFSNYFLLHKDNIHYYEQVLSVIPPQVNKIVWNEYFLVKRSNKKEKDPSLYRVLFQYPAFKWGLLTALGALLLFILLEMRRKQRMIPEITPPINDSLDFIKTIGRLYYDQNDHVNLAKKMSAYFLDHLRNHYKITTQVLDESFVATVHSKTDYPKEDLKQITRFIRFTDTAKFISDEQLSEFYLQLENFYQNA